MQTAELRGGGAELRGEFFFSAFRLLKDKLRRQFSVEIFLGFIMVPW